MNLDLYLFNLIHPVKFLDTKVFNWVNGFAGKWVWLDYFGIFCADYLGYILLFILAILLLINFKKYWKMVAESLIAAIFARFVLAETIRMIWFRARPFVSSNFVPLIIQSSDEASFPSGHATFYFALATIVYFYNKKLGILFFVASFFIAVSRIFVGVHWPSDILAGAILAVATALFVYKLFNKFFEKYVRKYFKNWA